MPNTCLPCAAARRLDRVNDQLRVLQRDAPGFLLPGDGEAVKDAGREWTLARAAGHSHPMTVAADR